MKAHQKRQGFTIIEVMLFLAITGALAVAILAGSNVAIGQQRYRDSVDSLKALIQDQYSQVSNVVNVGSVNGKSPACDTTANLDDTDTDGQTRGTSECLILGRFILVEPTKVTTYNALGYRNINPSTAASDIESFGEHVLAIEDDGTGESGRRAAEEVEISWGAQVVEPGEPVNTDDSEGVTRSILIMRSPFSGAILTFSSEGDHRAALGGMVSAGEISSPVNLCVDPRGTARFGTRQGVRINAYAAGPTAVEIPLSEGSPCA